MKWILFFFLFAVTCCYIARETECLTDKELLLGSSMMILLIAGSFSDKLIKKSND